MAKALMNVEVDLASEDLVATEVLRALPKKRFAIFGLIAGALANTFQEATHWKMREVSEGVAAGMTSARNLTVTKSGGRARVFAPGEINLAEEAELPLKSFKDFGEFVRRSLNGDLNMGATAGNAETPGQIVVVLGGGMTGDLETEYEITPQGLSPFTVGVSGISTGATEVAAAFASALGSRASSVSAITADGTMTVTISLAVGNDVTSISAQQGGSSYGTWNRSGYVAGTPPLPGNAILLDQVGSLGLRYVRVEAIPAGDDLATVTRPIVAAGDDSLFEF